MPKDKTPGLDISKTRLLTLSNVYKVNIDVKKLSSAIKKSILDLTPESIEEEIEKYLKRYSELKIIINSIHSRTEEAKKLAPILEKPLFKEYRKIIERLNLLGIEDIPKTEEEEKIWKNQVKTDLILNGIVSEDTTPKESFDFIDLGQESLKAMLSKYYKQQSNLEKNINILATNIVKYFPEDIIKLIEDKIAGHNYKNFEDFISKTISSAESKAIFFNTKKYNGGGNAEKERIFLKHQLEKIEKQIETETGYSLFKTGLNNENTSSESLYINMYLEKIND